MSEQKKGEQIIKSETKKNEPPRTPKRVIATAIALVIISIITCPETLQPTGKPSLQHVFYYGWISAVSTGLGVVPLVFAPDLDNYWIGVANGKYQKKILKRKVYRT